MSSSCKSYLVNVYADTASSSLSGPGQLAHFAQIGRQLGYAGYYATDQMLWLAGVGLTRPTKEYVFSPVAQGLSVPVRLIATAD